MAEKRLAIVLHGGAGALAGGHYERERVHMRGLMEAGLTSGTAWTAWWLGSRRSAA